MSLTDKLADLENQQAAGSKGGQPCRVGILLLSSGITDTARDKLQELLDVPAGTPGRVTTSQIGRLLRSENLMVGDRTIDRHRRRDCRCYYPGGSL